MAALEETILKLKTENDELRRKLEHMNEIFANVQRARFGQSSEKKQLSPARAGGAAVPGKKPIPRRIGIVHALGTLYPAGILCEEF